MSFGQRTCQDTSYVQRTCPKAIGHVLWPSAATTKGAAQPSTARPPFLVPFVLALNRTHVSERPSDRATERPSDNVSPTERPSDRTNDRVHKRLSDHAKTESHIVLMTQSRAQRWVIRTWRFKRISIIFAQILGGCDAKGSEKQFLKRFWRDL